MKKNSISDWMEAVCSKIRVAIFRNKVRTIESKWVGVEFYNHVLGSDLSFSEEQGNSYSASPDFIKKLCKDKVISARDTVMDLGCGKGYALYQFGQIPFGRIVGIELDEKLAHTANRNIGTIFDKESSKFMVINADACTLMKEKRTRELVNDSNYFYIFNSFPPSVAECVIRELEESCREVPRKIVIWYVSPGSGCIDGLTESNCFHCEKKYRFFLYPKSYVYEFQSYCK